MDFHIYVDGKRYMASKLYSIDKTYDMHKLFHLIEHSKKNLDLIFMFKYDSSIYLNSSNLQILKALAKKSGRVLKFEVENNNHLDYIDSVNNDNLTFSPTSIDLSDTEDIQVEKSKKQFFKVPKFGFSFKKKQKSIPDVVFSEVEKDVGKFKLRLIFVLVVFFVVLTAIVSTFWAALYYLPRATVKLQVNSETLVNLVDVKAKTNVTDVIAEDGIIPATLLEVEETEVSTMDTTGEQEVGEFASGEVTLYNKTDDDIRVKKGTKIKLRKDDNNDNEALMFIAEEEIKVPAKTTEDIETGTTTPEGDQEIKKADVFGSKKIKIKAEKFGPEYNIDKKQKFEIDDYNFDDELEGENDDNIKGGTVDTVRAVADVDLRTIRKGLEDALRAKAIEDLKKKVVDGQSLQEASMTIDPVSEEYSNAVGEITDKLTLKLTIKATGIAYSDDNLKLAINELIKKVVPESFNLSDNDDIDYDVAVLKDTADPSTINLQVKLKSYVFPKIDLDKIRYDLVGLKIDDAKEYLDKVKNVNEYEIELRPKLPAFLVSMPRKVENIKIEIIR